MRPPRFRAKNVSTCARSRTARGSSHASHSPWDDVAFSSRSMLWPIAATSTARRSFACHEAGITVTLPKAMTSGAKSDGRFGKQDFAYLAEKTPIAVLLGSGCHTATRTKKTARCCVATGPQPVRLVRSNRNVRPGQSDGLHGGSMSICSMLRSSALIQIQTPCASVERQSSTHLAR